MDGIAQCPMVILSFFGAIFKKNGLVKTYLSLLYLTLILEIATGVFSLVMFYRFRDGHRPDCVKKVTTNNGDATIDYCVALDDFAKLPVWSVWVSSMIPIVIVACKPTRVLVVYDTLF